MAEAKRQPPSHLYQTVAFDAPVATPNGQGGTIQGWSEQVRVRAGFTWLRGGEEVIAARLAGVTTAVVRVRRASETEAITTAWRLREIASGAVFNVRSILPTEDRRYLDLTCQSGVST